MSVINKVLRDLDQRQNSAPDRATAGNHIGLRLGTATVPAGVSSKARTSAASTRWRFAGVALVVAGLALGGWWWQSQDRGVKPVQAPASAPFVVSTAEAPPAAPASAPRIEPVALLETPETAVSAPPRKSIEPAPRADARPASRSSSDPLPLAPTMALRMEPALAPHSLKEPLPVVRGAASAPQPEHAKSVPAVASAIQGSNPNAAANEALAQAQNLWNAGSREAAVDLLRDAVAIAERAGPSGSSTVLVLLLRELTRMQLAEGQFGAVWEVLTHLEPHLGNQPDLWAIRANAAQRLGRHEDSVHAYLVALQSRPTEQRWLLGAAVSLAALGKTISAAEMAEKARSAGPISKDVQTYLRQMNVPFKD